MSDAASRRRCEPNGAGDVGHQGWECGLRPLHCWGLVVCAASAQQPLRFRGTIEKVDGNALSSRRAKAARDRAVADNAQCSASAGDGPRHQARRLHRAAPSRRPTAARRRSRCTSSPRRCAAAARGTGPWAGPNGTMTNGGGGAERRGLRRPELRVTYKMGDKEDLGAARMRDPRLCGQRPQRAEARRQHRDHERDQEAGRHDRGDPQQCRPQTGRCRSMFGELLNQVSQFVSRVVA